MPERIEIPDRFPDGRRARPSRRDHRRGRGLGELIAHAFSPAGANVALVAARNAT